MQNFVLPIAVAGTLAADITYLFKAPFNMSLQSVSIVGTNANNAQIKIGTVADDDAHMVAKDAGDTNAPLTYGPADFVGAAAPQIAKGDLCRVFVDFDGAAGNPIANLSVLLGFTIG